MVLMAQNQQASDLPHPSHSHPDNGLVQRLNTRSHGDKPLDLVASGSWGLEKR